MKCGQWCATLLSELLCCCSLIVPHMVTCMHDKQCQPHGKALMISLPSLNEKWLHCLSAEHFICFENYVQCVFDMAWQSQLSDQHGLKSHRLCYAFTDLGTKPPPTPPFGLMLLTFFLCKTRPLGWKLQAKPHAGTQEREKQKGDK